MESKKHRIQTIHLLPVLLILFVKTLYSQQDSLRLKDSVHLNEIVISSYLGDRPVLRLPASVALVDSASIGKQNGLSLVPVLNTVPGVRMEERSPGSYRLSIRGSLIRSPFGIRNVKVYIDELPLTNGGGDTYFNLLDQHSLCSMEVLKGPDGSLFGANSGGVVRVSPFNKFSEASYVRLGASAGSYGMQMQDIALQQKVKKNMLSVHGSWQRANGYRENSAMDRKFVQLSYRINYTNKAQLRPYFFYSDLNYQTPGGLTLVQYTANPKQARPSTPFVPGAAQQQAAIRNRTFFGGVTHEAKINDQLRHVISVFGSQTLFENPFITNYEVREEGNAGARTYFELTNNAEAKVRLTWNIGGEFQEMQSRVSNYGNRRGVKDTVQAVDVLEIRQGFAFTRLVADLNTKWITELSLSYNANTLQFSREQPLKAGPVKRNMSPEFMPRLSASYLANHFLSLRAIVSRGYSPPTLQEIRSSNTTVNAALQAESGWNYEAGLRLRDKNSRLYWDLSAFYYALQQAIVKHTDDLGQDYFVNAGTTFQPGVESLLRLELIKARQERFIRGLQLSQAYTFNFFRFGNYSNDAGDFSGNDLTGVPRHVSVTGLSIHFPKRIYLFMQHNYTAKIPLNDLNSEYAKAYHLILLKAGWTFSGGKLFTFDLSAGVDNLLDQRYSLGNDLNALGGRYYNAAMPRNYFVRFTILFKK